MKNRYVRWGSALLLAILLVRGCFSFYYAKAIEAWIIDAETRKPVQGAVVVARWKLVYGLEGGYAYDWVVMETVTDENGRFTFPAWGPRAKPSFLPWDARLEYADPEVQFYKFGYAGVKRTSIIAGKEAQHTREAFSYVVHGPWVREWVLNGETFEYQQAKGDLKMLTKELNSYNSGLISLRRSGGCQYLKIPRSLNAVKHAYDILRTQPGGDPIEGPRTIWHARMAYMPWTDVDRATLNAQRNDCGVTANEAMEAAE